MHRLIKRGIDSTANQRITLAFFLNFTSPAQVVIQNGRASANWSRTLARHCFFWLKKNIQSYAPNKETPRTHKEKTTHACLESSPHPSIMLHVFRIPRFSVGSWRAKMAASTTGTVVASARSPPPCVLEVRACLGVHKFTLKDLKAST